jgi:hypothetical protein
MNYRKLHRTSSIIHKWAGITIGIQVILWIAGGLVMSWFNIGDVRGDYLKNPIPKIAVTAESYNFAALNEFIKLAVRPISSARTESLYGKTAFVVRYKNGDSILLDAKTAKLLPPFTESQIRKNALQIYTGKNPIQHAELLDQTDSEYKGKLPVWKIDFADDDETSFYLSPTSGKLVTVRTSLWRFYDFMWMLHIMDYDTRDDFNHPLLYLSAFGALIFSLSGFILIFFRFTKRDVSWLKKRN